MIRLAGWLILGALVCLIFVGLIGRAMDREIEQRVIFTRHGQTLDCNRTEGVGGRVFYTHCNVVP